MLLESSPVGLHFLQLKGKLLSKYFGQATDFFVGFVFNPVHGNKNRPVDLARLSPTQIPFWRTADNTSTIVDIHSICAWRKYYKGFCATTAFLRLIQCYLQLVQPRQQWLHFRFLHQVIHHVQMLGSDYPTHRCLKVDVKCLILWTASTPRGKMSSSYSRAKSLMVCVVLLTVCKSISTYPKSQ